MTKRLLLIALLYCIYVSAIAQEKKPNILVIISDDHALSTIGAYGSTYGVTPNIDRIAKQGAVFTNAFVTNSICAPSRAVMLTGKYSHINGHKTNLTSFDGSQDNFSRQLRQVGFQTAWIGKWHLVSNPQGFDYWTVVPGQGQYYNPDFIQMNGETVRREGYCTDIITDLATSWLDQRDKNKPFCMVVGQKAPHRTWMPDLQDLGKLDQVKFPLPANFYDDYDKRIAAHDQDMTIDKTMRLHADLKIHSDKNSTDTMFTRRMNEGQRTQWNAYYDKITDEFNKLSPTGKALVEWKYQRYMKDYLTTTMSLDRNIGKILDYLDKNNLAANTIVIYTSDQGFYMGEHGWFDKRFMYEESMHMPLVMRYPGVIKPGTTINDMVVNIDFTPTFEAIAGAKIPADIQGKSILPLLKGDNKNWRKSTYYHYYEFPAEHSVMKHFGIRTSRYKLIRFYTGKDFWELYDLQTDPHEMKNLYGEKQYESLTIELKNELKGLIKEYKDDEAMKIMDTGL